MSLKELARKVISIICLKIKENRILIKIGEQLLQQLKPQSAEIVKKINSEIYTGMVVKRKETKYTNINFILDNILKEYQKDIEQYKSKITQVDKEGKE